MDGVQRTPYLFQAVAFAVQIGIVFEVIGEDNPLARNDLLSSHGCNECAGRLHDGSASPRASWQVPCSRDLT